MVSLMVLQFGFTVATATIFATTTATMLNITLCAPHASLPSNMKHFLPAMLLVVIMTFRLFSANLSESRSRADRHQGDDDVDEQYWTLFLSDWPAISSECNWKGRTETHQTTMMEPATPGSSIFRLSKSVT